MEQMEEFMFLGLRKMQGVSEKEFETQFGNTLEECYGKQIERFLKEGLLERKDGYLNLTKPGINVSNYVLAEFLH
jgi:oxygen-independent coproporphyrinogen-3 oxidase